MIERSFDYKTLEKLGAALEQSYGFDAKEIIENTDNFFLKSGNDYALFEGGSSSYSGHYFFTEARGAKAIATAKEMLAYMFNQGAQTIKGLTPVELKAARRLTRIIGFTSYGLIDTVAGPMELFILTKKEFNE